MNKKTSKLIKILLSLFALNLFSLYLYFSHSHSHSQHRNQNQDRLPFTETHFQLHPPHHFSKAWPIIPSYLPWSQNPNVGYRSCEAFFGNGFSTHLDLLPAAGSGGWFRCYYSETLGSSICEGGKVKMDNQKIKMSRGGEKLEGVMGRADEEELPTFENGAFQVEGDVKSGFKGRRRKREGEKLMSDEFIDKYVPQADILKHTMRELLGSLRIVDAKEFDDCDQWVEEPTLLVTRYEYANLFHTMTDWYNAYISSRVTGLPNRPHVVFVDGHCTAILAADCVASQLVLNISFVNSEQCFILLLILEPLDLDLSFSILTLCPEYLFFEIIQTQLEETWDALFSSFRYAKNFSGPVCFRHAIFSPLGYENVLFKGLRGDVDCHGATAHDLWQNPDDKKTARLSEFGEMIRAAFGLQVNRHRTEKPGSGHNVLFVRREDYLAHPRHGGKVESRLSNEQEVFDSLQSWASNYLDCKINLVNGLFAHMAMKEQVRAIQDASVIIGAHGAGLTHIVSATAKTVILEIVSGQFRRPHFEYISKWKGLEYHAIYLDGSYAKPTDVIDKLSHIIRNLGC
ncbi:hypothetical protein WN944_002185 [Citrus x changshan-huyou]|uniref:Glycosyltransferase 61 catalytic domain-containing protein n=1 Tax=Citrus x changshan-huyou TaxID=2935761 RepID=A0AAP0QRJ9_9ROSI